MYFTKNNVWHPIILPHNPHNKRGLFVVFEGIDGCGKTTTINNVFLKLKNKGYDTIILKTPTEFLRSGGMWKIWTEQKVDDDELFGYGLSIMAFGERIAYQQKEILHILENNIVLMDRFLLSSLVYECGEVHEKLSKLLITPDIGILLDAPIDIILERINKRDYETLCDGEDDVLNKLKYRYIELAQGNDYFCYDTDKQSVNNISDSIVKKIVEFIKCNK